MKVLVIFVILLQLASVFTGRHRLLHKARQLQESFPAPTTHDNTLAQLVSIIGLVASGTASPITSLWSLELLLNARPEEGFAVIFNASNSKVRFEGCPTASVTRVFWSCLTQNIQSGKASFVMKQHG